MTLNFTFFFVLKSVRKMSVSFAVVCSVELGAVDGWTNLNSPAVLWLGLLRGEFAR